MGSFDKKNDKNVALWEPRNRTHFLLGLSHTQTHTHSDMRQSNKAEIKTECAQDHEGTIPD